MFLLYRRTVALVADGEDGAAARRVSSPLQYNHTACTLYRKVNAYMYGGADRAATVKIHVGLV